VTELVPGGSSPAPAAPPRTRRTGAARRLRIRVLQVAYDDAEPVAERIERVAALVRRQHGADLVVLPELWAHGGFAYPTWRERAETLDGPVVASLSAAAREIGAAVHLGSIVERAPRGARAAAPAHAPGAQGRGLWNTSLLLNSRGGIDATYRKIHRFGFGEGEPALMEPGDELVTAALTGPDGARVATAGLATCYDLRFPELFRQLLDAGSEIFLVPAAWPAARVDHWTLLGRARAVENQCVVVQCNTAGTHSGLAMGGHSQVVGPTGAVLAEAGGGAEILAVEVDFADVAAHRKEFPVLADRRL
jgi:predicted amidohydrolase